MYNIIKQTKGFTLVELVIVIVIVGILSVISVPIYRGYVEKAMLTEGKILVNAIGKAELGYHVKNGWFYGTGGDVSSDDVLDINAEGNKYFKRFNTNAFIINFAAPNMAASSTSSKIKKVGEEWYCGDEAVLITVYGYNNGKNWTLVALQEANGSLRGYGPNGEIIDVGEITYTD